MSIATSSVLMVTLQSMALGARHTETLWSPSLSRSKSVNSDWRVVVWVNQRAYNHLALRVWIGPGCDASWKLVPSASTGGRLGFGTALERDENAAKHVPATQRLKRNGSHLQLDQNNQPPNRH